VIPDGSYDVFVIDALPLDDGRWQLDLTIVAGDHKSEVLSVKAVGMTGTEFDLMGMPGTLTVADGTPSFRLD
jgi:hypothetical protein